MNGHLLRRIIVCKPCIADIICPIHALHSLRRRRIRFVSYRDKIIHNQYKYITQMPLTSATTSLSINPPFLILSTSSSFDSPLQNQAMLETKFGGRAGRGGKLVFKVGVRWMIGIRLSLCANARGWGLVSRLVAGNNQAAARIHSDSSPAL